jgi:Uma2 family endonuclease
MSPSYHHGYVCLNLGSALKQLPQFSVFVELSLQLEKEYIPDVCVYPKRTVDFAAGDIVRMTEMPLAVMEVLSPSQTISDIMGKFDVYFGAGVTSCWLVIPPAETVTVYTAPNRGHIFKAGNVVDPVLQVEIPLQDIFL